MTRPEQAATASGPLSAHLCVVEAIGPAPQLLIAKQLLTSLERAPTSLGVVIDQDFPNYVSMAESSVGRATEGAHTWPPLLQAALSLPVPDVTLRVTLQTNEEERIWVVQGRVEEYFAMRDIAGDELTPPFIESGNPIFGEEASSHYRRHEEMPDTNPGENL